MPRASEMVESDTIVVKAGVEQKKYTLHKRLLIHHSEYFRGALSGKFRETDDGVIPLDDVEVDVFDAFVDWVYEKKLPHCVTTAVCEYGQMSIRARVYILADMLMAPGFKSAVFDVWYGRFAEFQSIPAYFVITFAFSNLPEHDPLLQLLIDAFCRNDGFRKHTTRDEASDDIRKLPHEAYIRIFLAQHAMRKNGTEQKKLQRSEYDI